MGTALDEASILYLAFHSELGYPVVGTPGGASAITSKGKSMTGILMTVARQHITVDHHIMGGVPCITGTRIPVATIVAMVAEGTPVPSIVDDFPQLSTESVYAALQYAADAVRERQLPLPKSA